MTVSQLSQAVPGQVDGGHADQLFKVIDSGQLLTSQREAAHVRDTQLQSILHDESTS